MNATLDLDAVTDTSMQLDLPEIEPAPTQEPVRQNVKQAQLHLDTVERQKAYVAKEKAKGGAQGVVFQEAFIRGMRDLGYKDPSWALSELIDNSVQAGATTVDIRLGFDQGNASQAKNPSQIAIVDDGTGMHAEMIGYSVRWGGTDREDDRNGFGRFGYGLPSACVSIACKYTVYSKVKGSEWHAVHIDLKKLAHASSDQKSTEEMLTAKQVPLPAWLLTGGKLNVNHLECGTIIVLEELDRLKAMTGWVQVKALKQKLLSQFGIIYRHWIPEVRLFVDDDECESVDPLFLLPHARFVDETSVKAKKIVQTAFDVTTRDGKATGTVKIRASYLHPQFSWATPDDLSSEKKKNKRWDQVLVASKGLNGLLVCREGRQIDVVQPAWTKFQNYDIYVKIEIDFDPVLDEYFSITTSKQQIRIDDDMVEKLRAAGKNSGNLNSLIMDIRRQFGEDSKALRAKIKNLVHDEESELPSANAMMEAARFKTKTPRVSQENREEAERNLTDAAAKRAKATGQTESDARKKIEEEIKKRPWDIEFQAIEEGPFFIPKRMGEQKRIVLNTAHPFYSRLYDKATGDVTSALEVLLFVLADGEIDADGHRALFYKHERNFWSEQLSLALNSLVSEASLEDEISHLMEVDEQARASGQ